MQLMRTIDRSFTARSVAAITGIESEAFYDLKRGHRMAAFTGGVPAMLEAGWAPEDSDLSKEDVESGGGKIPSDLWVGVPLVMRSPVPDADTAQPAGSTIDPVFEFHSLLPGERVPRCACMVADAWRGCSTRETARQRMQLMRVSRFVPGCVCTASMHPPRLLHQP